MAYELGYFLNLLNSGGRFHKCLDTLVGLSGFIIQIQSVFGQDADSVDMIGVGVKRGFDIGQELAFSEKEYEGISLVCQGKACHKILYDGSLVSGKMMK